MTDLDPGAIAVAAAEQLAAEMCPALPKDVARLLAKAEAAGADGPADGGDLASLVVVASHVGCRLLDALLVRTDRPAPVYLENKLRREMGIDEGMSDDLDRMVEAVVAALMRSVPR